MIAFIEKLNSEVLRSIERIESRDTDVLKKSLEASRVLGEAFDRLKQYIIGYRFQNDDEEIKFFKEIKPRLFCRLIYYRKLYNIEMNRPVGSIEHNGSTWTPMFGPSTRTRRNASTYPLFPQRRYTPGQPLFPARADRHGAIPGNLLL